jgi:hypothetical protein
MAFQVIENYGVIGIRFATAKTVRSFSRVKVMVMLWGRSFIAQACVTRSYRRPARQIVPNDWVIDYQDEDRLPDLIAVPSIFGLDSHRAKKRWRTSKASHILSA